MLFFLNRVLITLCSICECVICVCECRDQYLHLEVKGQLSGVILFPFTSFEAAFFLLLLSLGHALC